MNNLWHFGDSWSCCNEKEIIFSKYVADHFNLIHRHHGEEGLSNWSIFTKILHQINNFKSGDTILINWSFMSRMDIVTKREDNTYETQPTCSSIFYEQSNSYTKWIMEGILNHSEEEYFKLFILITIFLKTLQERGITILNVYQDPPLDWHPTPPTYTLKFNKLGSYHKWVWNKGWAKEQSIHYTWGIQQELAKEYINVIDYVVTGIHKKLM